MLKNFSFKSMNMVKVNDNGYDFIFKNVNVDGMGFDLKVKVRVERGDEEITHVVRLDYYFSDKNVRHVLEFKTGVDACEIIHAYDKRVDEDILKTISSLQAA